MVSVATAVDLKNRILFFYTETRASKLMSLLKLTCTQVAGMK